MLSKLAKKVYSGKIACSGGLVGAIIHSDTGLYIVFIKFIYNSLENRAKYGNNNGFL